jgi:hypothetical protein
MQSFFEFQDKYLDELETLFERIKIEIGDLDEIFYALEQRWLSFYQRLFSSQGAIDGNSRWVDLTENYKAWKEYRAGFVYPMGLYHGAMMTGFSGGQGYASRRSGNRLDIGLIEGTEAGEHAEYFDGGHGKGKVNPRDLKLTYAEMKRWEDEIAGHISGVFEHLSTQVVRTGKGRKDFRTSGYRQTPKGKRFGFVKAADISSRFQRI